MAFKASTLRVLIASPSDMPEERRIATDAINEWNTVNSATEHVVLLPIKWETNAVPTAGKRPQAAINEQLVAHCDMLVGMFWTKLGAPTGVAESGTVEEVNQIVAAGKPAMLFFSSRPIDPNKIDLKQHAKLRRFKASTYQAALSGTFASLDELRAVLARTLTQQVRSMAGVQHRGTKRVEEAAALTELLIKHKQHGISREGFEEFRKQVLGGRPRTRSKTQNQDPPPPGEVGPNGGRIDYMPNGDKVEWVKDEDDDGKPTEWPLLLRRGDAEILANYQEFWDKVWWNRHQVWRERIASGQEPLADNQKAVFKKATAAARRLEKKYGKKNLGWDDFEWGLLSGRMSALAWVMGAEWNESLDT